MFSKATSGPQGVLGEIREAVGLAVVQLRLGEQLAGEIEEGLNFVTRDMLDQIVTEGESVADIPTATLLERLADYTCIPALCELFSCYKAD